MAKDNSQLTDVEMLPDKVIYWIGTPEKRRNFGIAFDGAFCNIDRQGTSEGVLLALTMLSYLVDRLGKDTGEDKS